MGTYLAHFDVAKKALIEAKSIDEVKAIRDKAEMLRAYAKQAKESLEMQNYCAEIKLRAERRAGEMLREQEKNPGGQAEHESYRSHDVTTRIPRIEDLGINRMQSSRWQKIADLEEETFEQHIDTYKQEAKELTTASVLRLYATAKAEEIQAQIQSRPLPDGIYSLIYADPPWSFEDATTPERFASKEYALMTLDEIEALPVSEMAADDSALFLWCPNSKNGEAHDVIRSWGFIYKTNFVWVKDRIGLGHYNRQRHELLLVATKGSPGTPQPADRFDSVIECPRGEHSRKPEIVYEMLEKMYPGVPKIELFARGKRPGWEVWGHEAEENEDV